MPARGSQARRTRPGHATASQTPLGSTMVTATANSMTAACRLSHGERQSASRRSAPDELDMCSTVMSTESHRRREPTRKNAPSRQPLESGREEPRYSGCVSGRQKQRFRLGGAKVWLHGWAARRSMENPERPSRGPARGGPRRSGRRRRCGARGRPSGRRAWRRPSRTRRRTSAAPAASSGCGRCSGRT